MNRLRCDQCEMLSINGVACHETGCPNSGKTWMEDRQEWVRFVECFYCGCEVETGEECSCADGPSNDDWLCDDNGPLPIAEQVRQSHKR
jgi:hypothetical protein